MFNMIRKPKKVGHLWIVPPILTIISSDIAVTSLEIIQIHGFRPILWVASQNVNEAIALLGHASHIHLLPKPPGLTSFSLPKGQF